MGAREPSVEFGDHPKNRVPFSFQLLRENRFALDRLDLKFRWGAFGLRVLRCHLATFPPGKIVPTHKHSEYEFHFIPRGRGKVVLQGQAYALGPRDFYVTGPEVAHYQEADEHDPMEELCLHIDIQKIETGDSQNASQGWGAEFEIQEAADCIDALQHLPHDPIVDQCNAMQWFSAAYRAWYDNPYGAYETMRHCIIQILLRSVQNYTNGSGPFDLPYRDMNTYRYQLATQFVQDNYSWPITLEDVADRLHISPRQLQRIFAQQHGQTFREYVEQVRLTHVCEALLKSDDSIEQVAEEHGFSSSNYLHYVFKKRFAMTPTEFKRRYQRTNDWTPLSNAPELWRDMYE